MMGSLAVTNIILSLSLFCAHTVSSSPVAGPNPNVNIKFYVDVNGMNVNDQKNDKDDSSSTGHESCNVDCKHWCYPSTDWAYTCANACNGKSQSPIDICGDSHNTDSGSFTFSPSYSEPINKITIKNNGHTAGASWDSSLPSRTISGGGLTGDYTLAQFHFHWGCENSRGSEHTVNGTRYAMELHFVHFKTAYGNLSEALKYEDGLAVLGVFFDVGTEDAALKPITDSLPNIIHSGSQVEIDFNIALTSLIPTMSSFYRYQGSLTTPTCNEVVIWSVFSNPLSFSEDQLKAFRMLKDHEDHHICDNYRGIQPLNGREVNEYLP